MMVRLVLAGAWTALLGALWLLGMWVSHGLPGREIYGYGAGMAFFEAFGLLAIAVHSGARK